MEQKLDDAAFRAMLGTLGLVTGLSFWALSEFVLGQLADPRLELGLVAVALGFFFAALMLSGPLSVSRALLWACAMAVGPPALLVWASLRFASVEAFLRDPYAIVAFSILLTVPLPFLIAADRRKPWDYTTLFNEAWLLVIRGTAAAVFLGVFWGVYMICNLLLALVGVRLLDLLVDQEPFVFGMSGLVGGIALAVLYEMRRYLSPLLLLKLLQLLLIPVTVVVVVFVVRVPIEGLDQVFSGLSAGATLLAMTFGLATLITSALDCEPRAERLSTLARWTIQTACLLMPVLALLGSYAIWLRVAEYGWTPERVAAACVCALGLGYGALYSVPVILRRDWDRRIRRANILTAIFGLVLAASALTPLLDAQRMSAQSQLDRFKAGDLDAAQLPIRDMGRNWGHAGQVALEELRDQGDRDLQALLEDALRDRSGEFGAVEPPEVQRAALMNLMPRAPEGAEWPEALWGALPPDLISEWLSVCRAGPDSCVAVIGNVDPGLAGDQVLVVLVRGPSFVSIRLVGLDADGALVQAGSARKTVEQGHNLIRDVRRGAYRLAVPERRALVIGDLEFFAAED